MRIDHQDLLQKNRSYLLHNLCPGEEFWSALLEMGVFEADLLDEIKVGAAPGLLCLLGFYLLVTSVGHSRVDMTHL